MIINRFYLLFLLIKLFYIKLSVCDQFPEKPESDFYEKKQYLDYYECRCDDIRRKLQPNFGVKQLETDGTTFRKNELNYVGTVYLIIEEIDGHANEYKEGILTFVPLCRGVLLNNEWALTTAACVKTFDSSYFNAGDEDNYQFGLGSNHNLSEYHAAYKNLLIEIKGATIHEEYNSETGHANLALLKLDDLKPGLHREYGIDLLPGCLQDEVSYNLNSLYPENVFYTVVNDLTEKYRKNYDFKHKTDTRDKLIVAENLQPKLIKVSVRELKVGGDPHCSRGYFCIDSKYKGLFCPTDNGFPLIYYNAKTFRLEIIGINDAPLNEVQVEHGTVTGAEECRKYEPTKPITFFNIYDYLKWILNVTKKICVTPELIRKRHKYCGCRNKDFKIKGRIIGGGKVKAGDFQYIGYFSGSKGHYGFSDYLVTMFCTTTLINRKYSLTTASCIYDKDSLRQEYYLFVAVGGNHIKQYLENDKRHWRGIQTFIHHPEFKIVDKTILNPENDIGLIEHNEPFDYGGDGAFIPPLFISPACLQDHDPFAITRDVKETFSFSYALGYGHLEPHVYNPDELQHNFETDIDFNSRMLEEDYADIYVDGASNWLLRTNLKYFGKEEDCGKIYKEKPVFCFKKGLGKICKPLDLGGPLVRLEVRNNKFYVSGIAFSQYSSRINKTHWNPCDDQALVTYANVYDHLEFITSIVGYDLCWTNGPYNLAYNSV